MIGWGGAALFGLVNWIIVGGADLNTSQLLWTGATAGALGMQIGCFVDKVLAR